MPAGDTTVLEHYLHPFRAHLDDERVTEIVVNKPGEFAVEREGRWTWIEAPQLSPDWLGPLAIAAAAATAQDVQDQHPICTTVLPTGERCQIVLPPAADSISLTFRRPSRRAADLEEMIGEGLFDEVSAGSNSADTLDQRLLDLHRAREWRAFFTLAVESRRNILISGATGAGKTTLAKGLIRLIPQAERLITIEDARELQTPHRNAVHLLYAKDGQGLAQIGPKALLESALRMRPDRILLQELRDEAAYFYLRNVNSGHPGSITTIHANSARLAFEQLTLLVKESQGGRDLPRGDIHDLLRRLVDIVVQVRRVGGRFQVVEVWFEPDRRCSG